jgi:hypothetical protein
MGQRLSKKYKPPKPKRIRFCSDALCPELFESPSRKVAMWWSKLASSSLDVQYAFMEGMVQFLTREVVTSPDRVVSWLQHFPVDSWLRFSYHSRNGYYVFVLAAVQCSLDDQLHAPHVLAAAVHGLVLLGTPVERFYGFLMPNLDIMNIVWHRVELRDVDTATLYHRMISRVHDAPEFVEDCMQLLRIMHWAGCGSGALALETQVVRDAYHAHPSTLGLAWLVAWLVDDLGHRSFVDDAILRHVVATLLQDHDDPMCSTALVALAALTRHVQKCAVLAGRTHGPALSASLNRARTGPDVVSALNICCNLAAWKVVCLWRHVQMLFARALDIIGIMDVLPAVLARVMCFYRLCGVHGGASHDVLPALVLASLRVVGGRTSGAHHLNDLDLVVFPPEEEALKLMMALPDGHVRTVMLMLKASQDPCTWSGLLRALDCVQLYDVSAGTELLHVLEEVGRRLDPWRPQLLADLYPCVLAICACIRNLAVRPTPPVWSVMLRMFEPMKQAHGRSGLDLDLALQTKHARMLLDCQDWCHENFVHVVWILQNFASEWVLMDVHALSRTVLVPWAIEQTVARRLSDLQARWSQTRHAWMVCVVQAGRR